MAGQDREGNLYPTVTLQPGRLSATSQNLAAYAYSRMRGIVSACRDVAVEVLLDEPLHVPGAGVVDHSHPAITPLLLAALVGIDGRHDHPLHLPGPALRDATASTDGRVGVPLSTLTRPGQMRRFAAAWAARVVAVTSHAQAEAERIYGLVDQMQGRAPVHGAGGAVLTGEAAVRERHRVYDVVLRGLLTGEGAPGFVAAIRARIAATQTVLLADLGTVRLRALERFAGLAEARRDELLDGGVDAVGPEQLTAVRLLAARRQAGMRALRAAATTPAVHAALATAAAQVAGVLVEGSPRWVGHRGRALELTGGRLTAAGATVVLSVEARSPAGDGRPLGAVVLDAPHDPAWTVADTPLTGAPVSGRAVRISLAGSPSAGDHDLRVIARNARGPAALDVRISVPG